MGSDRKKPSRSPARCKYFLMGTCAFGDGCHRPHRGEANANNNYNEGESSSYESPVDNTGTSRRSRSNRGLLTGEGEERDPSPSKEIDAKNVELPSSSSNSNVGAEKETCSFFLEGSCGNGSTCDFSHSIPKPSTRNSKSPYAPRPSDSKFLKPFKAPHASDSSDLSQACRLELDSPLRPDGDEGGDTSPGEAHNHQIEGDITDASHEARDRMDQAVNPDPVPDDETYQEHPSNHNTDNQLLEETVESCANHSEPVNKSFKTSKPASYYGDEWEERSPPPPPPLAIQLQERQQRAALPLVPPPPPKYPHISEIIPHWTQFADPHAKKEVPFCKQLAQGGCSQREGCRFRHSLTVEEYILLFNDQQPNLWTLQRDGVNDATISSAVSSPASAQPQVDSSHSSAPLVTISSAFGQDCKFYPIGKCRNGERCPFRHTEHPVVLPVTTSKRPDFGAQRLCKYYLERGYCSWGLSCLFRHDPEEHPSSGPSGPESAPSAVDNDQGCSTVWEEGNKVNDNSDADTPAEDDGWGAAGAAAWGTPSSLTHENYSAWDTPGGNTHDNPPTRKSNVCFQYTKGLCHRGQACRFSHDQEPSNKQSISEAPNPEWPPTDDSSHSAPWNIATPVQCPYYLKGNCRKGSLCHMSHDSNEKPHEENLLEPTNEPGENSQNENEAQSTWKTKGEPNILHENIPEPTNEPGEISQNENETQSTWKIEGEPNTLHENQPKAQETDSHIVDNEATWSQPWPTETVQPPSFPIMIDAPCMRFGQGYCPFGDSCSYLHIEETEIAEYASNSEGDVSKPPLVNDEVMELEAESIDEKPDSSTTVELESIIFDHPVVERHILNCTVRFGIDATPDQIATAADSKKLILSNLPVAVLPPDIQELVGPFGEIHSIMSLDETEHTARIEVEFAESSDALTAFRHLNGRSFESHTISANLKGRIPMTVVSSEHTRVVKVSWPASSASAWIHYTNISQAKSEAIRLDGVIVGGLQIKAAHVPPLKRQKSSFAVEIKGLPVDISKDVLMELCPEQSCITMNTPFYTQDPTNAIRSALARCGELEDLDIPPTASRLKNIVAFAMFKNTEMALEAVERLDGRNQDFLGGQPLDVGLTHYFRHRVTIPQFEAVKNEVDRLTENGEKKCNIQYQEQRERRIVWVRIHASLENLAPFASLNTALTTLLRGMLLTSNGDVVWDDYFETSSSAKSIDTINTTNSEGPFFVQCDSRTRNVRIFGANPDQERAKKIVMRMLQKVRKLQHEIQIPRTKLHDLVNGGFKALQDDLGVHKLSLDVANAKLIVRASSGDNSQVEDYIESLDPSPAPVTTEASCEICHHPPIDPILLSCRHAYCTACLQIALRYSPSAPFQCIWRDALGDPTTQCPANVPYVVIRDILPIEEKSFLHASFLSYVRSNPDKFFFCPTLDCQSVYRTGIEGLNLKCFICVSEICSLCQTRAHIGITCKENRI